jgi:hypothetical protein
MPSSEYYRQQAKVLLSMALAARDPERAERFKAQAELYLAQAELPNNTTADFDRAVETYNDFKMRGA